MRFDDGFNSKSSRKFYKDKPLKNRISKLNSIAKNNDKPTYIHEDTPKRKADHFNLAYKEWIYYIYEKQDHSKYEYLNKNKHKDISFTINVDIIIIKKEATPQLP